VIHQLRGGTVPKIIVGIDVSDRSKDALALAAQLARGAGGELVLVGAYPL
jgi:nucleotide-binding universal stress UspA family protein